MAERPRTVEALVVELLGARAETMTRRERDAAVRAFVRAGTAAVRARAGTTRQAAEAIRECKGMLGDARMRMARTSRPGPRGAVVDAAWRGHRRALAENTERLRAVPGVIGYALGWRRRAGVEVPERTVVVYVRSKRTPAELKRARREAVPEFLEAGGRRYPTDVVELGEFERLIDAGCSIGPQGTARQGTLGTYADDNATGDRVALTAMHVTGLAGDFPPGAALRLCAPSGGAVLGTLLRGTMAGVDAAKIAVDAPAGPPAITGIGEVRGFRPVTTSGDMGTSVRMFGAQSRLVAGTIVNPSADLPDENLSGAILVNLPSVAGDSGAALVDNENLVLGLLVGRFQGPGGEAVFSPIGSVLHALDCDIPTR